MLSATQVASLTSRIVNSADIFNGVTDEFREHFVDDIEGLIDHWNEEQKLTTDRVIYSLCFEDVIAALIWDVEYFTILNAENINWFHELPKQVQDYTIAKYAPLIESKIELQDWMDTLAAVISYTDLSLELSKTIDYLKNKGGDLND